MSYLFIGQKMRKGKLEKKFSKLYDKHIDKIYRFIYLKVDSVETAQDLTSQVFTKGWKVFQLGQDIQNPSAYLFQLARTTIADHYRKTSHYQIVSLETVSIKDEAPAIEEAQQMKADLEKAKGALKKLEENYQNVLIMRYLDDLPIKTIAEVLQKPESTIRVMTHRGLKMLREKMGKE